MQTNRRFSPKIFLATMIIGLTIEAGLASAYGSFTSQTQNSGNTFSTSFWITPTPTSPVPTETPTLTPTPTTPPSPTATNTPTPTPTATPTPPQVVLNEFMPHPNDNQDWVEIFNIASLPVDISGWKLADTTGTFETFASGTTIAANGFRVIVQFNRLGNSGDSIFLNDSSNVTVDSRSYTGNQTIDVSIGRDTDGTGNWETCGSSTKGTSNTGSC